MKSSATRRTILRAMAAAGVAPLVAATRDAMAFGEEGAFNPRILLVGDAKWKGVRETAPARWADEVDHRTSAPARLRPSTVRADTPDLFDEPFVVWAGTEAGAPLLPAEVSNLREFFTMGGLLFVDDSNPETGAFLAFAKEQLARILPEQTPIAIGTENVIFRSFYLLKRAYGRVAGPEKLEGIIRGGTLQVILSSHDVLGALARDASGTASLEVVPGGEEQREQAVRLAVNIALYVLCSNYKDDQVHAEQIMKRRGRAK
ncbi:MAG: DUF4159 domain-containing protein [Polyangiaceae bacterium]